MSSLLNIKSQKQSLLYNGVQANLTTSEERKSSLSQIPKETVSVDDRAFNSIQPFNTKPVGKVIATIPIFRDPKPINRFLIPSYSTKKTLTNVVPISLNKTEKKEPNLTIESTSVLTVIERFKVTIEKSKSILEQEIDYFSKLKTKTLEESNIVKKAIEFLRKQKQTIEDDSKQFLFEIEQEQSDIISNIKDPYVQSFRLFEIEKKLQRQIDRFNIKEYILAKRFEEENFTFYPQFFVYPLRFEATQLLSLSSDVKTLTEQTKALIDLFNQQSLNNSEIETLTKAIKTKQEELVRFIKATLKPNLFLNGFELNKEQLITNDLLNRLRKFGKQVESFYGSKWNKSQSFDSLIESLENDPSDDQTKKTLIKFINETNLPEELIIEANAIVRTIEEYQEAQKAKSLSFLIPDKHQLEKDLNLFRQALRSKLILSKESSFSQTLSQDSQFLKDLNLLRSNIEQDISIILKNNASKTETIERLEKENKELKEKLQSIPKSSKSDIENLLTDIVQQSESTREKGLDKLNKTNDLLSQSRELKRTKLEADIVRNQLIELKNEFLLIKNKLIKALETVEGLKETNQLYRNLSGLSITRNLETNTIQIKTVEKSKLFEYLKKQIQSYKNKSKEAIKYGLMGMFTIPRNFQDYMQDKGESGASIEDIISRLFQTEEQTEDLSSLELPSDVDSSDLETIVMLKNYLILPLRIQWMIEIKKAISNFVGYQLSPDKKISIQDMNQINLAFYSFFQWLENPNEPLKIVDLRKEFNQGENYSGRNPLKDIETRKEFTENPKVLALAKRLQETWKKYEGYKTSFTNYIASNYKDIRLRKEEFDSIFEYLQTKQPIEGYIDKATDFSVDTEEHEAEFFGGRIFGKVGYEDASIGFSKSNTIQDFEALEQNFRKFFSQLFYNDFNVQNDLSSYF